MHTPHFGGCPCWQAHKLLTCCQLDPKDNFSPIKKNDILTHFDATAPLNTNSKTLPLCNKWMSSMIWWHAYLVAWFLYALNVSLHWGWHSVDAWFWCIKNTSFTLLLPKTTSCLPDCLGAQVLVHSWLSSFLRTPNIHKIHSRFAFQIKLFFIF